MADPGDGTETEMSYMDYLTKYWWVIVIIVIVIIAIIVVVIVVIKKQKDAKKAIVVTDEVHRTSYPVDGAMSVGNNQTDYVRMVNDREM